MSRMPAARPESTIEISISTEFREVEELWRAFERSAAASPYQQFDWLEPWYRHIGAALGYTPLLVVGRIGGDPVLLWPMATRRAGGLTICQWLGGKQNNYNLGLHQPSFAENLTTAAVRTWLDRVAELAGGIDVFELLNQPFNWEGAGNPFAGFDAMASPSPCYRLELQPDYTSLEKARRSARTVQTLGRKGRKLERDHGALAVRTPADAGEFDVILKAFLDQRGQRFQTMGIANVFAGEGMRGFLGEVGSPGAGGRRPVLWFHALTAGDAVCATYGGLTLHGHYSCFINSIDEATFGAYSPGELLLSKVIESCCDLGFASLDLGMGRERYKLSWCAEDPLFDCFVPITALGRLYAIRKQTALALKRTIRSNPRLWALAKSMRKRLYRG